MADEEVATRAPESDAKDDSEATTIPSAISSSDTAAQTGPSMGEHCTTDRPIPASLPSPQGELTSFNDVACYISKPGSYPSSPGKLLLLLTPGTGILSTANQLQADAYAARGFVVVMPDQFGGDAAPATSTSALPDGDATLIERIKMGAAETAKSFLIDMWLARHTPEKVLPVIRKALEGAKESFADAVANGDGVYGAGYCFGGKYILLLLAPSEAAVKDAKSPESQPADPTATPAAAATAELKAGVVAHGTLITSEDVENVRQPVNLVCVAGDALFTDSVREQGRAALELNNVPHEVRVFEDVPHGFAVVGEYPGNDQVKQKQAEAFQIMAEWLEKY